jgi:hypothetical protein
VAAVWSFLQLGKSLLGYALEIGLRVNMTITADQSKLAMPMRFS